LILDWNVVCERSFGIFGYCSMYVIVTATKVPLDERALKTDEEKLLTVYWYAY